MAMPADQRARVRVDEFVPPRDDRRYEILDGEVMVRGATTLRHERILRRLLLRLTTWAEAKGAGEVFGSGAAVVLEDHTCVVPDLLFVSTERAGILAEDAVRGPPDLVVEVLSPGTRGLDMIRKRDLYDRFGVAEYWLVDPEADVVTVLRRDGEGRLAACEEFSLERGDGPLASPGLPGFALELDELLG